MEMGIELGLQKMFPNSYFSKKYFNGDYFPPIFNDIPSDSGWRLYKLFNLIINRTFEVSLES